MPEPADFGPVIADLALHLSDAEFEAFVKLGQGGMADQVFVALDPDAEGRVLHLQVMFLPGLTDPPVLQYFVGLPYAVESRAKGNLCRFLCAVNAVLPIAGFEYHETQHMLFFRHNHCVAVTPLDGDVVAWTVTMVEFVIAQFGPLVEAVAAGAPLTEARKALVSTLTEIAAEG